MSTTSPLPSSSQAEHQSSTQLVTVMSNQQQFSAVGDSKPEENPTVSNSENNNVRKDLSCNADNALRTLIQLEKYIETISACLKNEHTCNHAAEAVSECATIDNYTEMEYLEHRLTAAFEIINKANKTLMEIHSEISHPAKIPRSQNKDGALRSPHTHSFLMTARINHIQDLITDMTAVGHGGEGRVFRGRLRCNGEPVAVKSYFMDCEQSSRIEFSMMTLAKNIHGVKKPIGLINTPSNFFLIIEDDLHSVPLDSYVEKEKLSDSMIQSLFSQMVRILNDLNQKYIKHRDIKLENFLFNVKSGELSIIDFGWSMYSAIDRISIDEVRRSGETLMGTCDYLPPENYSPPGTIVSYEKATVYALGCILLELFFGYQGRLQKIMPPRGMMLLITNLSKKTGRKIPKGVQSLLDKCTRYEMNERLSLDGILHHPWVPSDRRDLQISKFPLLGSKHKFKSFEL